MFIITVIAFASQRRTLARPAYPWRGGGAQDYDDLFSGWVSHGENELTSSTSFPV